MVASLLHQIRRMLYVASLVAATGCLCAAAGETPGAALPRAGIGLEVLRRTPDLRASSWAQCPSGSTGLIIVTRQTAEMEVARNDARVQQVPGLCTRVLLLPDSGGEQCLTALHFGARVAWRSNGVIFSDFHQLSSAVQLFSDWQQVGAPWLAGSLGSSELANLTLAQRNGAGPCKAAPLRPTGIPIGALRSMAFLGSALWPRATLEGSVAVWARAFGLHMR